MSISAGQPIVTTDFINAAARDSTPSNDSGRVAKFESDGRQHAIFQPVGFGDGSDGTVTISSPTSLARDMFYDTLTVNDVLTTNGYRIFVKNTLSGNGTIKYPTANNGGNASGTTAGSAGAAYTAGGILRNVAGQTGGSGTNNTPPTAGINGTVGTSAATVSGGNGGNAGNGNLAQAGTLGGNVTGAIQKFGIELYSVLQFIEMTLTGFILKTLAGAGAGGQGGRSSGGSGNSGAGGGGPACGGPVLIFARVWAGTFTISSIGGNGGNGGNSPDGNNGGGGGAPGGNGGVAVIMYAIKSWTGSYALTGGTKGTKGNGTGTGANGSDGQDGATGTSYEFYIGNLI